MHLMTLELHHIGRNDLSASEQHDSNLQLDSFLPLCEAQHYEQDTACQLQCNASINGQAILPESLSLAKFAPEPVDPVIASRFYDDLNHVLARVLALL